jgi:3-deoxy-D-manno-octulosonic-acid transferase
VVVVGRSFGDLHGSDPIEPVALGKATLIGERYSDFESIVVALKECGAVRVIDAGELEGALRGLLGDAAARRGMGERGRACILEHQGATKRHAELILKMAEGARAARARRASAGGGGAS